VEATTGATSRILHLFLPVILFSDTKVAHTLLSLLHTARTIIVPDTLCNSFMINITWGWKRLDDWL